MHSDKTIIERLTQAAHSDDLSHQEHICDVDYLAALGMAGTTHRHGSALLDLDLTLTPGAALEALKRTAEIVRKTSHKRGWPLTSSQTKHIAKATLRYYLKPACECCKGRGMLGLDRDAAGKAQRVRVCDTCSGSGRAPLPIRYQREIRAALEVMERQRHEVGVAVRRKMRVRVGVE